MKLAIVFLTLAVFGLGSNVYAYDSNLNQKVKYNQQRAKWKIKAAKERMKKKRSTSSSYGNSSSRSSYSRSSSSKSKASKSRGKRTPSVSAMRSLQTFMIAANRATRLEQLYPYALKKKAQYWHRLNPKAKQKELLALKKWTYGAKIISEESKPMVATVKLRGTVKGAHLWNENGVWKFSDVIR